MTDFVFGKARWCLATQYELGCEALEHENVDSIFAFFGSNGVEKADPHVRLTFLSLAQKSNYKGTVSGLWSVA